MCCWRRWGAVVFSIGSIDTTTLLSSLNQQTTHKKKQEDLTFLDAKSAEMADKLEKTLAGEVQHRVREQFVRWLDAAVAQVCPCSGSDLQ